MPQFRVFSKVEFAPVGAEDNVWKFRGIMTAESDAEAINMVAETDAKDHKPGDNKIYASCRASAWVERTIEFALSARELDKVADEV